MKKSVAILFSVASLAYTTAGMAASAGPSGGAGGSAFYNGPLPNEVIDEVQVRHGAWIDSVELIYRNVTNGIRRSGGHNGGWGGGESRAYLAPNEYITTVWGYTGSYVNALNFRTNLGRYFYRGNAVGAYYQYDVPGRMTGVKGRSGAYLDAVGVVW